MTDTAIASATYIVAGAPSKEPAHNDALNRLEQLAQITVVNRTTTSAPASPAQGAAYIVASGATGVWSAQVANVAAYYSGWFYLNAREGWRAYDQADNLTLVYDGSVWTIERLTMQSHTVSGLPSASTAAQMVYVTDASGGALPAFSDGANWRRVTDRSVVD
jgi:hypothetical protein